MECVTTSEQLRQALARPWPVARLEGALARAPQVVCCLAGQSLGQVCRWAVGPAALTWREGQVWHDPAALARTRLAAGVWRDPEGTPFFGGDQAELLDLLPAGATDRLLQGLDEASGYRPIEPPAADATDLLGLYRDTGGQWIEGLLPGAPEAALYVAGYDFAALVASEEAATLSLPGGSELRLEVLALPRLVAAAVRSSPQRDAPPLLDEELARALPYGACRAVVAFADGLSEIGGPLAACRFPER